MPRPTPVAAEWLEPQLSDAARPLLYGHRPGLSDLYGSLGNAPRMLSAWLEFAWKIRLDVTSPRRLRELAIVLVGKRFGAPYEVAAHTRMALEAGATEAELEALERWSDTSLFDETDRAALALTDAMFANTVTDEITAEVERLVGKEQLIELMMTIGYYQMVSSVTQALQLVPPAAS